MHLNVLEFTLVVSLIAAAAGFLGALTGLGGGVVITPVLTLMLGVDIRYAIGATLISVIATSSGAAAAYVREGFSNIRIGMFLEIATTLGAVLGAWLATRASTSALGVVFGMWWTDALAAYAGQGPVINFRGRRVGAHALCVFEYEWVRGERWPRVRNSHSPAWGDRGTMVVAPDVFDQMIAGGIGARGISGLPAFTKRKLDLIRDLAS